MSKQKSNDQSTMKKNNEPRVIQLTPQGLNDLKAELQSLLEEQIPEVIKRVALARGHGDLSENAEYQNAREEQQLLEARAAEIEEIISKAKVVQNTKSSTTIGMGTTAKVSIKGKKGKTFTYTIVGEFEANPLEGKISSDSPIGKALVGSKKGQIVVVQAPAGKVEYLIDEIL
jgi:transcription elongation factor GreA